MACETALYAAAAVELDDVLAYKNPVRMADDYSLFASDVSAIALTWRP